MNKILRTVSLTIANATAANTTKTITFGADSGYNIKGFAAVQRKGTNLIDIGLRDTVNIYIDPCASELFEPGNADVTKRFYPIDIPGNKNTITITAITQELLTADNTFEFIFELERIDKAVC